MHVKPRCHLLRPHLCCACTCLTRLLPRACCCCCCCWRTCARRADRVLPGVAGMMAKLQPDRQIEVAEQFRGFMDNMM